MKNTRVIYMYRDNANYKQMNSVVVSGEMTASQFSEMKSCCEDKIEEFIPEQLGLPLDTGWSIGPDDNCYAELQEYELTDSTPTVGMTVEELLDAFRAAKGSWDNVKYWPQPEIYDDDEEGTDALPEATDTISAQVGNVRAEWYNADEGWCGDYDPEDPDDENLLRFDIYVKREGCWEAVEDASYCTRMPATADPDVLKRAITYIAKQYADALRDDPYATVERLGEGLSWIGEEDFQPAKAN